MVQAPRACAVFVLCLAYIAIAGCSRDKDQPSAEPVGDCSTSPVPGLDCECFKETASREQYAAVAGKLDGVAQLNRAEENAAAIEFDQNDIDEMLALIGDVETACTSQH